MKDPQDKKRHYVYLCGNITADPESYAWRERFRKAVKDLPIVSLDPTLNSFNQDLIGTVSTSNAIHDVVKTKAQRILRAKDYQLVKIASVVVVNLGFWSMGKPPIGTVQELVWAHDIFYIPVIAITMGENNPYTKHAWIDECCSAKVETLEEAVEMLKTFFLEF